MSGLFDNFNVKNVAIGVLIPAVTMFDPQMGAVLSEANADFADGKISHDELMRLIDKTSAEAIHLFPQLARILAAAKALIVQGEPLVEELVAAVKELEAK